MKKILLLTTAFFAIALMNGAMAQSAAKNEKEVPAATVSKEANKTAATAAPTTASTTKEGEKTGKKGKKSESNCKKGDDKACCKAKNEGKKTSGCCMPKEEVKSEE